MPLKEAYNIIKSRLRDLKYRNEIQKWNFIVVLRLFFVQLYNALTYRAIAPETL